MLAYLLCTNLRVTDGMKLISNKCCEVVTGEAAPVSVVIAGVYGNERLETPPP